MGDYGMMILDQSEGGEQGSVFTGCDQMSCFYFGFWLWWKMDGFERLDDLLLLTVNLLLQASGPWAVESATWRQVPGGGYVLDDYPCEEFHALATAELPGSVLLRQRRALLELLEANWDTG